MQESRCTDDAIDQARQVRGTPNNWSAILISVALEQKDRFGEMRGTERPTKFLTRSDLPTLNA